MKLKHKCIDKKLLFSGIAFGVREVRVVYLPRQLRHFWAAVMDTVLQPLLFTGVQSAHVKIHQPGDRLRLRFFSSGKSGTGFADMRGVTLAGKLLVCLILTADFAVMPMRTAWVFLRRGIDLSFL